MADAAVRIDRASGRARDRLIAAVGDGAHDQERQAGPRGDLRHAMAFHVDRYRAGLRGQGALGRARRHDALAAGDRRACVPRPARCERCGEPVAPGRLGRDPAAVRQDDEVRQEQSARRQVRREPARKPEAHQPRHPSSQRPALPFARAPGSAPLHRTRRSAADQAARLGAIADDDPQRSHMPWRTVRSLRRIRLAWRASAQSGK